MRWILSFNFQALIKLLVRQSLLGALQRVSGILKAEHEADGVRVFNLHPGFIATERMAADMAEFGFSGGEPPELVANTIVWLATQDEAVQYTGTTIEAQFFCHERGLRGHELAAERERAVDRLFRAASPEAMRAAAADLGVEWVFYGIVERERYAAEGEIVLERLHAAGPVAAAFPPESPRVFLFDLRRSDTP